MTTGTILLQGHVRRSYLGQLTVTAGEGAQVRSAVPGPADPGAAHADRQSRAVLDKAARENFPVAPFFLPRAWRADLMAVYGYARLVDDIGDGDLAARRRRRPLARPRPRRRPTTASRCSTPSRPTCAGSSPAAADPGHPLLRALRPHGARATT